MCVNKRFMRVKSSVGVNRLFELENLNTHKCVVYRFHVSIRQTKL